MSTKRQIIIDTDIGVDDAYAIVLALLEESVEVVALTCVAGNVDLPNVLKNAGRLLDLVNKPDIPIYKGASRPLLGEWKAPVYQGHGSDGMGNEGHAIAESPLKPQTLHASLALPQLFEKYPDAYLITLGPLTNIALACSMDPSFPSKIKPGRFWMMGGSHFCQGNCSYAAEFNVHTDPEAAAICFERFSDITMISWEITLEAELTWKWYDEVVGAGSSPQMAFLKKITKNYETISRKAGYHREFVMCDMVAMAALLKPELIAESRHLHGAVELSGSYTRGATVFDWLGHSSHAPNTHVVMKMNRIEYGNYVASVYNKNR